VNRLTRAPFRGSCVASKHEGANDAKVGYSFFVRGSVPWGVIRIEPDATPCAKSSRSDVARIRNPLTPSQGERSGSVPGGLEFAGARELGNVAATLLAADTAGMASKPEQPIVWEIYKAAAKARWRSKLRTKPRPLRRQPSDSNSRRTS
jgi:hypothetical protein